MMYSRAGLNGFQPDIGTGIIPKQDVMTQKDRLKTSIEGFRDLLPFHQFFLDFGEDGFVFKT